MKISLSNIKTIAGIVVSAGTVVAGSFAWYIKWHDDKVAKDAMLEDLNKVVTEQVVPSLSNINDKLDNMATSEQVNELKVRQDAVRKDVNIILKYNRDALEEIKQQNEIDAMTMKKAAAYDDLKKNVIQQSY